MGLQEREQAYIRRQRRLLSDGDGAAASNIAAAYRILRRHRQAFHWWCRAAEDGDGDALVDVGYCYQHGLGVRHSRRDSEQAYRAAMATALITEAGREEAMYHLAVLLRSEPTASQEVVKLLVRASRDGDYPEAAQLLKSVRARSNDIPCVCRRGLRRNLAALVCPLHQRPPANAHP